MTNCYLYLVVCEWCLFGVQMTFDSRTGYLIFLQGSNSNFLAMWRIPCRHIRRQMLPRVVAHFFPLHIQRGLNFRFQLLHIFKFVTLILGSWNCMLLLQTPQLFMHLLLIQSACFLHSPRPAQNSQCKVQVSLHSIN